MTDNANIELTTNEASNDVVEISSSVDEVPSVDLLFSVTPPSATLPTTASVSFDATNVISYDYEAIGLEVIENEVVYMKFNLIAEEEFGTFKVVATMSDGKE